MKNESLWELLAKYFSGQASDREIEQLEAWVQSDLAHRKLFDELSDAWNATGDVRALDLDVSDAWGALSDCIDEADEDKPHALRPNATSEVRSERTAKTASRRPWQRLFQVAGGVALVVGVAVLVWMGPDSESHVIAADRGERSSFELIDGTHVDLNADSKLTVSPEFGQGMRAVRLDGEAYFDVPHVEGRPFRVETLEGVVRVVGTAFNVMAYADEKQVQVAVAEGRVALNVQSSAQAAQTDTVLLEPKQFGIMADRRLLELRDGIDLGPLTAWREGRLVFEDAPFSEVVRRLERWYNLQIDVQAPLTTIDRLNAVFDEEAVREVVGDIALALDLQFEMEDARVTFWHREAEAPAKAEEARPTQNSTLLIN